MLNFIDVPLTDEVIFLVGRKLAKEFDIPTIAEALNIEDTADIESLQQEGYEANRLAIVMLMKWENNMKKEHKKATKRTLASALMPKYPLIAKELNPSLLA